MSKRGHRARLVLATSAAAIAAAAQANEVTNCTYDPLGRLVATSNTGSVNNGQGTTVA
jgi:chorismate-pyruvate lyase